jgi:hypothetical protein
MEADMNKRPLIIAAVLIILTLACNSLTRVTSIPVPLPERETLHFENEILSFDYPEGMQVFNAADPAFTPYPENKLGGQLVAGLADPADFGNYGHMYCTVGFFRNPEDFAVFQAGADLLLQSLRLK